MAGVTDFNQSVDTTQFEWDGQNYSLEELDNHLATAEFAAKYKILKVILNNHNTASYRSNQVDEVRDELGFIFIKHDGEVLVPNAHGLQVIKESAERGKQTRDREGHTRKVIQNAFGSLSLHKFLKTKYPERAASGASWWRAIGESITLLLKHFGQSNITEEIVKKAWSDALLSYAKEGKSADLDLILNIRHTKWLKNDKVNLDSVPLSKYKEAGYRIGEDGMIEKVTVSSMHKHESKDEKAELAASAGLHEKETTGTSVETQAPAHELDGQALVPKETSVDPRQSLSTALGDADRADESTRQFKEPQTQSHEQQAASHTSSAIDVQQVSSNHAAAIEGQKTSVSTNHHKAGASDAVARGDGVETTQLTAASKEQTNTDVSPAEAKSDLQAQDIEHVSRDASSVPPAETDIVAPGDAPRTVQPEAAPNDQMDTDAPSTEIKPDSQILDIEQISHGASSASPARDLQPQVGGIIADPDSKTSPLASHSITTGEADVTDTPMTGTASNISPPVPSLQPKDVSGLDRQYPLSKFGWGYRRLSSLASVTPAVTVTHFFENPNGETHTARPLTLTEESTTLEEVPVGSEEVERSAEQQSGDDIAISASNLSTTIVHSSESEVVLPADTTSTTVSPPAPQKSNETIEASAAEPAIAPPETPNPAPSFITPAGPPAEEALSLIPESASLPQDMKVDYCTEHRPPLECFEAQRLLRKGTTADYFLVPDVSIGQHPHKGRTEGFFDAILEADASQRDGRTPAAPKTVTESLSSSEASATEVTESGSGNTSDPLSAPSSDPSKSVPSAGNAKVGQSSSIEAGEKKESSVKEVEDNEPFRDSKLTKLLPNCLAVDVRAIEDIKTSIPREAGLSVHQPPEPFPYGIPVGRILGTTRVSIHQEHTDLCALSTTCKLAGKDVFIFFNQPTIGGQVYGTYFGVAKGQVFTYQELGHLPIVWYAEFESCATQDGRDAMLRHYGKIYIEMVKLQNNILRDSILVNVIRARRAQLDFCQAEFYAGNRRIFAPNTDRQTIQKVSQWVDNQVRKEFPAHGEPVDCEWITRGRETFFFTSDQGNVVFVDTLRQGPTLLTEIERFLHDSIIGRLGNPIISTFVVYETWLWLAEMKANAVNFSRHYDCQVFQPTDVKVYLKLFACALIYAAAKHSEAAMKKFRESNTALIVVPINALLECEKLARIWKNDAYEIILMLLKQPSQFHEFHDATVAPMHGYFKIDHRLEQIKADVECYVGDIGIGSFPEALYPVDLSCNSNLEDLSEAIAKAATNLSVEDAQELSYKSYLSDKDFRMFKDTMKLPEKLTDVDVGLQKRSTGLKGRELDDYFVAKLESRIDYLHNLKNLQESILRGTWRTAGFLPV